MPPDNIGDRIAADLGGSMGTPADTAPRETPAGAPGTGEQQAQPTTELEAYRSLVEQGIDPQRALDAVRNIERLNGPEGEAYFEQTVGERLAAAQKQDRQQFLQGLLQSPEGIARLERAISQLKGTPQGAPRVDEYGQEQQDLGAINELRNELGALKALMQNQVVPQSREALQRTRNLESEQTASLEFENVMADFPQHRGLAGDLAQEVVRLRHENPDVYTRPGGVKKAVVETLQRWDGIRQRMGARPAAPPAPRAGGGGGIGPKVEDPSKLTREQLTERIVQTMLAEQ